MTELVASYATDRYLIRLIRPAEDSLFMFLQAESPSGSSFSQGADLKLFEEMRELAQRAEDNQWRVLLAETPQRDKARIVSGWERFRTYAGLPALNLKEEHGNDQQGDG